MNLRTLSLTIAFLVALSAAVWFIQRPAAPVAPDPRLGQSLLAPDLAARTAQLRLSEQGKTVSLDRQADGSWRATSYHGLPADFAKLTRFIGDLTEAKVQRLVTSRPDRLTRLEFKDTTITLLDPAGKELWHVTLGKNAEGGGRFVRYGTEEKGYLANLGAWLDAEGKNWADATLLNLKPDDIAGVELSLANGATVAASRAKKEDAWTAANPPAGKRLKADRIASLLSSVASLRFTDTTAPDDANAVAARTHSRMVKLTTFDKTTYTVILGRKPEEKKPKPVSAAESAPPPTSAATATPEPGKPAESAAEPAKPKEPEFETIPAGPVFAFVTASDEKAPLNEQMKKRAFQIGEWTYTGLPTAEADLWEDAPAAPDAPADGPANGK